MYFSGVISSMLAATLLESDFVSTCDLLCLKILELHAKRGLGSSGPLCGGEDFLLVSSLVKDTR